MRTPLVSILIPVYNVEKYLERCMDSIIGQTLTNIEIICVNDGSTDNSLEILKKYQKKDHRIIIVNKENGGLPSARNAGLDRARGKYVGFVDSDDYVERNMFQRLYETAVQNKSDVVICGAHIFPEDPLASGWLYQCLSPQNCHYDKFEPELLFQNPSATPFLWRVLIKRELIEKNNLRLDEKILLGEDKAFQAKVYPKANGITMIADKLYHYCWYREGSMMQQDVYNKVSYDKIKKHAKLICHIAEQIKESDNELKKSFLIWSIPFLYSDYIYLPQADKVSLAKTLLESWKDCGYYCFRKMIPNWITEQFEYFEAMTEEDMLSPAISVIMVVEENADYIQEAIDSILSQSLGAWELIIVNSGASDKAYALLHKTLFGDKRVRLYNMPKSSYAEALNKGIDLSSGTYTIFCDTDGWFASNSTFEKWVSFMEKKGTDICISPSKVVDTKLLYYYEEVQNNKAISKREFYNGDFHNLLFQTAYLKENDLKFRECSIVTGMLFNMESIMKSQKVSYFEYDTYIQRKLFHPDWISTQKVECLLEGIADIMELSVELDDADAHAKIIGLLNGDYYKRIIINNTRAYSMPEWDCPNGENSQIKTVEVLYQIMQMVNPELLKKGKYNLNISYTTVLCELMEARHKFLADISNQYCRL